MIRQIKSKKIELPPIFLIENEEDFKELPKGLPYIYGKESDLPFILMYLEFQTFLKSCLKTGIPLKWLNILERLGYRGSHLKQFELRSGGVYGNASPEDAAYIPVDEFLTEQYVVNFDRLAELKLLPVWLDDLKTSIQTNIVDEVIFDPTSFNKQLGLNVGSGTIKHHLRNLLILDVSGSIPDGVVKTTVALSKLMSKKFYADVIVTGGRSYFIDYDEVPSTDIEGLAAKAGRNNESEMFKEIVKGTKHYNTVIAFGDNDCPGESLVNDFKVENLYSLHTDKRSNNIVGYAKFLKPTNKPILIKDWVETLEQ